jgi:4-hydroxy-3-polyprenylbenzoate decarboxylase
MQRFLLAVTGASGMPYALALAEALKQSGQAQTHLIVSEAAVRVMELECDAGLDRLTSQAAATSSADDIGAPPASGSWLHHGMIVCPCSMASLGAIARGLGTNLIHRAADVCLKEKRPLILVPRETPLSLVHLENMQAAARAGATILPACPGFYHRPRSIDELIAHVVGRILDALGVEHELFPRWGEPGAASDDP